MKSSVTLWLATLLFFVLLSILTFNCIWSNGMIFSSGDLNIGRLAQIKNSAPDFTTGIFNSGPIMGQVGFSFLLFKLILSIMPLEIFANSIYGIILIAGSLSMVWFLRIWQLGWIPSIFGALVAFWFNSITLASSGHAYKMEVLVLSVLSLVFIEKSIRSSSKKCTLGFSILTGLVLGLMMIEQQDVALFAGLFIAAYLLNRLIIKYRSKSIRWIITLIPILIVSLSLSAPTILNSYERNIKNASVSQIDQDQKWNYITQWSMVPSEWPDLIAPGWSGWSSNHSKYPYWGKIGQSDEYDVEQTGLKNFKLNSNYLGIIPFIMSIIALIYSLREYKNEESKVVIFWFCLSLLALFISFGKYSILYKLFYEFPIVNNIRAPIKFLDNMQIGIGILSGFGLNFLIKNHHLNDFRRYLILILCIIIFLILTISIFISSNYTYLADELIFRMRMSWIHTIISILALILVLIFLNKKKATLACFLLILFLSIDSLLLTKKYFRSIDINQIKDNQIAHFLKNNQGSERIYFIDSSGIYNSWLSSEVPYHNLNLFNFWQMPRMSDEDKNYLDILAKNPIRLWQLSSVKYILAPNNIINSLNQMVGSDNIFQTLFSYQIPTTSGLRTDSVIKFNGFIPRVAQYFNWEYLDIDQHCNELLKQSHNPENKVFVANNIISSKSNSIPFSSIDAVFTKKIVSCSVESNKDSIIRFSQKYHKGWNVYINGKKAPLLRLDYLSMGVLVPSGKHDIEFKVNIGNKEFYSYASIFIISMIGGIILIIDKKKLD